MDYENSPGLDFNKLLAGSDDTLFADFCDNLGRLMVRELNKQPESAQVVITEAFNAGGQILAVTSCVPVVVTAVLVRPGAQDMTLFQITEESAWQYH